jgi:hypothetical protein
MISAPLILTFFPFRLVGEASGEGQSAKKKNPRQLRAGGDFVLSWSSLQRARLAYPYDDGYEAKSAKAAGHDV